MLYFAHEKYIYSSDVEWNILYMYIRSIDLKCTSNPIFPQGISVCISHRISKWGIKVP